MRGGLLLAEPGDGRRQRGRIGGQGRLREFDLRIRQQRRQGLRGRLELDLGLPEQALALCTLPNSPAGNSYALP